ncbi:MAG: hypothetical protein ABI999_11515 [Acidobacteriota bacterium]
MKYHVTKLLMYVFILLAITITGSLVTRAQLTGKDLMPQSSVKIIPSLSSMTYSIQNDGVRIAMLKLKLSFINEGTTRIFVYKNLTAVSHIWVSASEEKSKSKDFEVSRSQSILTTGDTPVDKIAPNDFASLEKGDTFQTEVSVNLFVTNKINSREPGFITPGKHVLQMYVEPGNWTEKEWAQICTRLQNMGFIVTDPIVSEPLNFEVSF